MRFWTLLAGVFLLAACGGGGGGSTAPSPGTGGAGGTSDATNTTIRAALNAYRASCGGTAMPSVAGNSALVTAATKHAGWQPRDNALYGTQALNHGEPRSVSNAFFVDDLFNNRIEIANGGPFSSGYYYEIIASSSGTAAVDQLWNTVYHRMAMNRPPATLVGYGDITLAGQLIPSGNLPSGDPWGYGTFDYVAPSIFWNTSSWWPAEGATNVPWQFDTTTESPDPVPGAGIVGGPLHVILPTSAAFTSLTLSLDHGGTHVPCYVMIRGSSAPTLAGDVSGADLILDPTTPPNPLTNPGEIYVMAKTAMSASTAYTWSMTAVVSGPLTYFVGPIHFTTGP